MVINSNTDSTPASLRRTHRGMALSRIQRDPGISRADLARELGFSDMAATRIVRELLAAGLVEEADAPSPTAQKRKTLGRPKTGLNIIADGLHALGITVSAYHSEVSLCDASGTVRAARSVANPPFDSVEATARLYAGALRDLIAETGVDIDRIVGIGVALSARTDPAEAAILRSEYFGWGHDGGLFCRELRRLVDLPVEIENIANALAIAEMRFGAARDVPTFALIHAATFIGASIVSEGRVVRGATGISGQIGHFRAQPSSLTCVCGRQDCLNLSASGFGLLSRLGRLSGTGFDRSRLGDYAHALLDVLRTDTDHTCVTEAGATLAPAIDAMAKLLGPQIVIVSGTLGTDPAYFDGARVALERDFDLRALDPFRLVRGTIAADRSAGLLALHAFGYSDRLDFDRFSQSALLEESARG